MFSRLRALLATARIANVPSVISNVLTGMLLAIFFDVKSPDWDQQTLLPIFAACCLYIAGNFLNDWFDAGWDQQHRPERAIPSGLFPRDLYLCIAIVLVITGGSMCWWVSKTVFFTYSIILCLVIAYTLLHKRNAFSIWIMGACRAGLYALGLGAMSAGFRVVYDLIRNWQNWQGIALAGMLLVPLLGMLSYIAGISLLARYESRPLHGSNVKLIASLLLLFPLMTHTCMWCVSLALNQSFGSYEILLGALPFACWTLFAILRKAPVPCKVSRLLAGIALVDSVFWWCGGIAYLSLLDASLLWFLSIPLLAFLLALLLQKIAPAT